MCLPSRKPAHAENRGGRSLPAPTPQNAPVGSLGAWYAILPPLVPKRSTVPACPCPPEQPGPLACRNPVWALREHGACN